MRIKQAVLFVLFTSLAWGQVASGVGTKEIDQQTLSVSGNTLTFPDSLGTQTETWEVVVSGGPATLTTTMKGCMRGGTCVQVGTSSSTANFTLQTTGGPYDSYKVTGTWTGGASPSILVNRTATVARGGGGLNAAPGQGYVPVSSGAGLNYPPQTKPVEDSRDDPLAGANICTRYNDVGTAGGQNQTPATASGSGSVVTLTTVSGNWPPQYTVGTNLTTVGCATAGYNGTFAITGGGAGTATLTYANATVGSGTGCETFIPLGSALPQLVSLEGEISNTNAACAATNIDNPKTQGRFNAGTVLNTDLGFNIGTWQGITGTLTDVVGVQNQVNETGSALKATNLFPNVSITATGTVTQTTLSITNASSVDPILLSPGAMFTLGAGDGVAGGYYFIGKCVTGAACANTVGGLNTSQFYSLPSPGTITINIQPALASSPSGAAFNLYNPVAELGDVAAQNTGQVGIANDWSRITGFQVNCSNIPGAGTAIGLLSVFAQEGSWFRDTTVSSCGIGYSLISPVDAGPFEDLNVGYGSNAKCPTVTIPFMVVDQATSIRRVTVNGNNCDAVKESFGLFHITDSPYNGSAIPGGLNVEQLHFEGSGTSGTTADGVLIDSFYTTGNGKTGSLSLSAVIGCPSAFPCTNTVHIANTFSGVADLRNIMAQSGGSTNILKNDFTGNQYTQAHNAGGLGIAEIDNTGSEFTNLNPTDMTGANAANVYNGIFHSTAMTKQLTADSAGITATTAATAVTQFTWGNLVAGVMYSFHCSGTTTQATGGAGIGIAFQTATTAATSMEAHATVATSATAAGYQSSGALSTTTYSAIYTGAAGLITTQLPWEVDGSVQVGATAPTAFNIGFFSVNAADAVTVKRNSYCTLAV
jgi:hypothetical protein